MNYQNINDERVAPFIVPFLAGALIATPFAYMAGNRPNVVPMQPYPIQPYPYYPIYNINQTPYSNPVYYYKA